MLIINRDNYKELEPKIYKAYQKTNYNDMCYSSNDIKRYLCGINEFESFLQALHDNGVNLVTEFPDREYTIANDFVESDKDFEIKLELKIIEHYMAL